MLIFRSDQMRAFEASALLNFERRIKELLAQSFPSKERQLASFDLSRHIESARSHGFISEQEIAVYLVLAFRFAPQFPDRCYWATEVLEMSGRSSPQARLDLLVSEAYAGADEVTDGLG